MSAPAAAARCQRGDDAGQHGEAADLVLVSTGPAADEDLPGLATRAESKTERSGYFERKPQRRCDECSLCDALRSSHSSQR